MPASSSVSLEKKKKRRGGKASVFYLSLLTALSLGKKREGKGEKKKKKGEVWLRTFPPIVCLFMGGRKEGGRRDGVNGGSASIKRNVFKTRKRKVIPLSPIFPKKTEDRVPRSAQGPRKRKKKKGKGGRRGRKGTIMNSMLLLESKKEKEGGGEKRRRVFIFGSALKYL